MDPQRARLNPGGSAADAPIQTLYHVDFVLCFCNK